MLIPYERSLIRQGTNFVSNIEKEKKKKKEKKMLLPKNIYNKLVLENTSYLANIITALFLFKIIG